MAEKNRDKLLRERFKNETDPLILKRVEEVNQKYRKWPARAVTDLNRYLLTAEELIRSKESLVNSKLAKELDNLFFYSFTL